MPPARTHHRFACTERPPVEVLHPDGRWYPGRLHCWIRAARPGRGWRAVVTYLAGPGLQHYREVPADQVRPRVPAAAPGPGPARVTPAGAPSSPSPAPPAG